MRSGSFIQGYYPEKALSTNADNCVSVPGGMESEPTQTTQASCHGSPATIIAALVVIFAIVMLNYHLPAQWDVVTTHSDNPRQVMDAIDGLESEIASRITALRSAEFRAGKKANEGRVGIGEPGETMNDAKKTELLERAPEWDEAARKARAVLEKYGVTN